MKLTRQKGRRKPEIDPATGEVRLVTMKTPGARPYGIKIDAAGAPWVACNGSNCLVRIDPETMALEEIDLPHADTHVRRLDIAADGTIVGFDNLSTARIASMRPRGEYFSSPVARNVGQ